MQTELNKRFLLALKNFFLKATLTIAIAKAKGRKKKKKRQNTPPPPSTAPEAGSGICMTKALDKQQQIASLLGAAGRARQLARSSWRRPAPGPCGRGRRQMLPSGAEGGVGAVCGAGEWGDGQGPPRYQPSRASGLRALDNRRHPVGLRRKEWGRGPGPSGWGGGGMRGGIRPPFRLRSYAPTLPLALAWPAPLGTPLRHHRPPPQAGSGMPLPQQQSCPPVQCPCLLGGSGSNLKAGLREEREQASPCSFLAPLHEALGRWLARAKLIHNDLCLPWPSDG